MGILGLLFNIFIILTAPLWILLVITFVLIKDKNSRRAFLKGKRPFL